VCDISCTYCFYTTGHERRSRFRVHSKKASHIAGKVASAGFNTVILSGGDPLHSRLKHETYVLVRELKMRGLRVIINTSAVCLSEDDLDTIINLGIDRIDISIDSHDASIHNVQRGRYADTVNAITGLVSKGYCAVATTTVVSEINAPTLLETIFWLRKLGIKDVRIQRVFFPDNQPDTGSIMRAMYDAIQHLHSLHALKYVELTERAFIGQTAPCYAQCRMGKEYFVCNAQGILTPCFHRDDVVLGNLFDDPVDALLKALERHELIMHDVPPCFGSHCVSLFDIPTFWRR